MHAWSQIMNTNNFGYTDLFSRTAADSTLTSTRWIDAIFCTSVERSKRILACLMQLVYTDIQYICIFCCCCQKISQVVANVSASSFVLPSKLANNLRRHTFPLRPINISHCKLQSFNVCMPCAGEFSGNV